MAGSDYPDVRSTTPPRIGATVGWSAYGSQSNRRSVYNGGFDPFTSPVGMRGGMGTAYGAPPTGETPLGQEMYTRDELDRLGKTSIQIAPGSQSKVLDPEEEAPEKRMPGFAEMFLGGITDAFTGVLPGFVRDPLVGAAQGLGQIADIPLEFVGHFPINQILGLEDRQGAFELLPDTAEKAHVRDQMLSDPTNADWYMARYLRVHGGDYAAAKGLPQLLAPLIQPDATVLERGLGVLGLSSQVIGRTVAGLTTRAQEVINTPKNPEEQELQRRYQQGQFGTVGTKEAMDRLLDEITTSGFAYSSDPFVSMLAEMALDPVILASFGTGLAAKGVRAGALARRASNINRMARFAARSDSVVATAVRRVDDLIRAGDITAGRFLRNNTDSTYSFAKELAKDSSPEVRRVIEQAEAALSKGDRVKVSAAPIIETAASISGAINEPFRIFGKDGAAGVVRKRFARNTAQGGIAAFDTAKVARIFRDVNASKGDLGALNEALGTALSYSQRSMLMGNLIRHLRSNLKDENGKYLPMDFLPDTVQTPDRYLDAVQQMEDPLMAQQFENFMRRVKEQYVPDLGTLEGAAREAEWARQMDLYRSQAAEKLAYAADMDGSAAQAIMRNAGEDMLAFADWVHFGRLIVDFQTAQAKDLAMASAEMGTRAAAVRGSSRRAKGPRASAEEGLADLSNIERGTLVGPRELTRNAAEKILADIENMAPADAAAYLDGLVGRYELLYQNFFESTRVTKDEFFVKSIKAFLKENIENDRLVRVLDRDTLPTHLRDLIDRSERRGAIYEVGIAPETARRWNPIYDGDRLIGYTPWMDIRVTAADVRNPTRFDVLRERLWTPIRAENMLRESRRKFISAGVRTYELDRKAAADLFDAIRQQASDVRGTMRGFTPHEFDAILQRTSIPDDMKQRLGMRGLAELTAVALEGDIRMVGVTSKLTGKMKTQTANYGNFIGLLAEKVYPLVRFDLNPFFLMQEWLEPHFFNILRGVKPGVRFGPEQVEFHELLDQWNMAGVLADGFEAREFAITGGYRARRSMGPQTTLGRLVSKMPLGRVQQTKKMNYATLTKRQFGDYLHESFEREFPGQWARIEAFFNELDHANGGRGHLSRGDIAMQYFRGKGMYDPDSRTTAIHHYDMAVPDDLGRIDGIRKSHVARMLGFTDAGTMRQAIRDGSVDEWQFRQDLVQAGASPEYSARAWEVARGIDAEELYTAVANGFADPAEGAKARSLMVGWHRMMAEMKGITVEEYVARKYATMPKWLDSSGRLPYSAYTQLTPRLVEEAGFPPIPRDDARYLGMVERAKTLWPDSEEKHRTLTGHINSALKVREGRVADSAKRGLLPETKTVGGLDLVPQPTAEDFIRQTEELMDHASIHGVGRWYREVGPMFSALAEGMDEATVRGLAEAMNETMTSLRKIDTTDLAEVRQEVGARMLMAWGATQVQTSPRDGFGYVLRVIDDVARGERKGSKGIGLFKDQQAQLYGMLRDFDTNLNIKGLGSKLHDFIDSLLGNETRTFMGDNVQLFLRADGRAVPMQPGAMDIWMGRDFGFIDSPYLNLIADHLQRVNPEWSADRALTEAQLQTGVFYRKKVSKRVWDEDEQKYVKKQVDEPAETYRKRKAEFEAQHGVTLDEAWTGSPSEAQYEMMLSHYNALTDELNRQDYLGRGYEKGDEWTVADVQAIAWMRIQKRFGIDPGGPNNMFHQNAAQVAFEIVPGKNTPLRDAIPMHRATDDAKDIITGEVASVLADMVQDRTGVTITRVVPGYGGWRGGPDEYTLSPNTFWEVLGNDDQIDDALDMIAYLTQQDMVFATKTPLRTAGKVPTQSGKTKKANYDWGIDFLPATDDPRTLDALGRWIEDQGFTWNGHMVGTRAGNRTAVRTVYSAPWETGEQYFDEATQAWRSKDELYVNVAEGTDFAGFEKAVPIPEEMARKLDSGEWATEAGLESPVVVSIERDLHETRHRYTDFRGDMDRADARIAGGAKPGDVYAEEIGVGLLQSLRDRGRADIADGLVGGDLEALTTVWDSALERADPNAWSIGRGERNLLDYYPRGEGPYLQNSPRGWRGATAWDRRRQAGERVAKGRLGTRRGRLYLNSDRADVSTAVHELFHFFADDLDPSAIDLIHSAYYTGKRKRARPTDNTVLTRDAEEWVSAQFEEYVATGLAPHPDMVPIFNAYEQSFRTLYGRDPDVNPRLQGLFESMTPEVHRGPSATFDTTQFRMLEAARMALQRAEEEAFRTHYYKRGRTLLERSVNHPYLGLYPASYMWGKVLPELMRFLIKKPFGVDAPFAGLAMANHVWEAIQLEMNTDDGALKNLVSEFPEVVRFLQLMTPGTPWDIPVNFPAWSRRIAQDAWQGKGADIPNAITDTVMYAFGPGRAPKDMYGFLQEYAGAAARAGQMAMGTYVSEAEREAEDARLEAGGLYTRPEEEVQPSRLRPEGVLP